MSIKKHRLTPQHLFGSPRSQQSESPRAAVNWAVRRLLQHFNQVHVTWDGVSNFDTPYHYGVSLWWPTKATCESMASPKSPSNSCVPKASLPRRLAQVWLRVPHGHLHYRKHKNVARRSCTHRNSPSFWKHNFLFQVGEDDHFTVDW